MTRRRRARRYALTLIDAADTLAVLGDLDGFRAAVARILSEVRLPLSLSLLLLLPLPLSPSPPLPLSPSLMCIACGATRPLSSNTSVCLSQRAQAHASVYRCLIFSTKSNHFQKHNVS